MTRALFCRKCGEASTNKLLSPEDRAQAWKIRHIHIVLASLPARHGVEVNGVFTPMHDVHCDLCNEVVPWGAIAIGRTMWRGYDEQQPHLWEEEFGTILTPEALKAFDNLSK